MQSPRKALQTGWEAVATIEIIDNAVQLVITTLCAALAGYFAVRKKSQPLFLLASFYAAFALGLLYWLLYLVLENYTPKVFYVSDLSWIGAFLFLLTLEMDFAAPEEKKFRPAAAWIAPAIGLGMMLFYIQWGDYVTNMLWCGLTGTAGWFAIRGLLFSLRQTGAGRKKRYFHLTVLFILLMENGLWTTSCYWIGDTLKNPYFSFDFALSAGLFVLLPTLKMAVDA